MRKNLSPWIRQLNPTRKSVRLTHDLETGIAIVGAGIAGVSTTFQLLEKTEHRITLIDRSRLAHGATGHNAGQVVGHFERGLASLAEEFGITRATQGQRSVEEAWDLLEQMYVTAQLTIPFFRFIGHSGYTSFPQVLTRLENNRLRVEGGLEPERLRISHECAQTYAIDEKYKGLYEITSPEEIRSILETESPDFIAAASYKKGCINSALFCESIVEYLQKQYPDRFSLYEQTPIHKIILRDDHALLDAEKYTIKTAKVILCTNGFENLRIINENDLEIDTKYHYLVSGKTGYMSGYLEQSTKHPTAISYYTDPSTKADNSYFYLTRRPYEFNRGDEQNLICVGGPDVSIEDTSRYTKEDEFPDEHAHAIDLFTRNIYEGSNKHLEHIFTWHGLMGYTRNGVRLVGPEPKNQNLLYNLGCNGVGILTSVYGASKIARHILGEYVEPSIFDVPTSAQA